MCSTLLVGEEVNPVLVPLGGPGKFLLNPCGQHNVIWASWNDQSSEFGNQNWQSWVCLVYWLVWGKFYHQRIWVSLKVYYDLCLPYVLHCFSILPLSLRSVSLVFWKIFWLGHFFFFPKWKLCWSVLKANEKGSLQLWKTVEFMMALISSEKLFDGLEPFPQ